MEARSRRNDSRRPVADGALQPLMALSFYSSNAGFDDEARGMGEDDLVNRMNPSEDRSDRS